MTARLDIPGQDDRAALEHEIQESMRSLRLTLDDMSASLERLRQLREDDAHALPEHALLVHEGPNGRPEVLR